METSRHLVRALLSLSFAELGAALLRSTAREGTSYEASFELMALERLDEATDIFELCWDAPKKSWRNTAVCGPNQGTRQHFLCHRWLVGSCVVREHPRCAEVDEMCQTLHVDRPVMALRSITHRPLNFIHIPKNAGTAVEEAGYASGMPWGRYSMNGLQRMKDNSLCVKWHVPPRYLEDEGMLQTYQQSENFCVVRHPYDRAVSEYLYLLGVPWGTNFSQHLYEEPECTEEGLNNFLQREIEHMDASPFRLDCHMLPQARYIWGPDGHQFCNKILHMDDLPEHFNTLMKDESVQVRMDTQKVNGAGRCGDDISISSLWPVTKDMIHKAYGEDFNRLGFPRY